VAEASIKIRLLGRFEVAVDGNAVADSVWTRRQAATLVKLLALAPGRRLHREEVLDAVWPDEPIDQAVPKLHKAAHFARRATGCADTIMLRNETAVLFAHSAVEIDAVVFETSARAALAAGDTAGARRALACYSGELLPQDPYEDWVAARREQLHQLHLELLRLDERWQEVADLDAGDERAHLELMRRHLVAGDRHAALRQFERLDRVLRRELGVAPSSPAVALRDRALADVVGNVSAAVVPTLIGRAAEIAAVERALDDAAGGRSQTILVSGSPGIGKTALLAEARAAAARRGWRTGYGTAAPVEGAWPYAPVIEALADVCRRHPTLLDGLADTYRAEIDRALAGADTGWAGETGHQRLFVAAAELLRLAGATHGVLLAIDDVHDADDASLRLLHYLARASVDQHVIIAVGHRPPPHAPGFARTRHSLLSRHHAIDLQLTPLDRDATTTLITRHIPDPDATLVEQIDALAGGIPFAIAELARRAAHEPDWVQLVEVNTIGGIPPATREVLQRVAVIGTTFDTDGFAALSGLEDEADAFAHLDTALASNVVERTAVGYRFRHGLVRDALLDDVPPHRRRLIHADAAARLSRIGASPAQIGHHLLEGGEPVAAVPHILRAAETAASIGAYRDALDLVDRVRATATGGERSRLLQLRADLLSALGDPTAIGAYREALAGAPADRRPLLRARLARAAIMAGDLETAAAALDGVRVSGGPDDAEILLAQGHLAWFNSDFDRAWDISEEARWRVLGGDKNWQVLSLVALQGLLAHRRGEWFDRMRHELRRTRDVPEIANAVFDGYLCPAEYLLYGPTPYREVIDMARGLRTTAQRSGALRAVAFAGALIGEAALLSGNLEPAASELAEACDLHHDLGSAAGEAHCLQRLAEVRVAEGDLAAARALLDQALPLARWSMISMHLLQRIYGTMIVAAPDPTRARAVVDRAESTIGLDDTCLFCSVMLAVPATIACALSGDLVHARHHLALAEQSAKLWQGTAWEAALIEARAHLAAAEHDGCARALFDEAADRFDRAGHPLDTARCRQHALTTPSECPMSTHASSRSSQRQASANHSA
jgi:DNA-binding SARP family transcriptional activator/tetratricopeptide (TPR) repeat protein